MLRTALQHLHLSTQQICISFPVGKKANRSVKDVWKSLQRCVAFCDKGFRVSVLPTGLPSPLKLHPLFLPVCPCSNLVITFLAAATEQNIKQLQTLSGHLGQPLLFQAEPALTITDICDYEKTSERATYGQKTLHTARPHAVQAGTEKKGPLKNWQLQTSHFTKAGNKLLHRTVLTYTKGRSKDTDCPGKT